MCLEMNYLGKKLFFLYCVIGNLSVFKEFKL